MGVKRVRGVKGGLGVKGVSGGLGFKGVREGLGVRGAMGVREVWSQRAMGVREVRGVSKSRESG